jgi:hypothetical protein
MFNSFSPPSFLLLLPSSATQQTARNSASNSQPTRQTMTITVTITAATARQLKLPPAAAGREQQTAMESTHK